MSLLLDALRKSETQRRRGRAPSIEPAPGLGGTSMRGPRRRRWPWLTALAVLVIAVAAAWPWLPQLRERLAERDEVAHSGDGTPPMQAAPGTGPAAPDTAPGEAAPDRTAARRASADGGGRAAGDGVTPDAPASGDSLPEESAAPAATPPSEAAPRRVAAPRAEPVRPLPEAERAAGAPVRPAGGSAQSARPTPPEPAAMPARPSPASEPASEPRPEPESAPEPALDAIRPWDLPQAQRLEFPELDVTVHFYAGEPADRFVLINGERYGEGDRIDSNVRVARIVRQGVVVTFGSYRVLVE